MKTWDDWSDFDISKAVADSLNIDWHCKPDGKLNSSYSWVYSDSYGKRDGNPIDLPDYCNSWADMGPLMVEKNIGVWPLVRHGIDSWIAKFFGSAADSFVTTFSFECKNPLRAAAIVFLMMNGVKPC